MQTHFVAHVPAGYLGERLAALLWSPPTTRRLLLAVTAGGRAFSWTMEDPAGATGDVQVACINQWYGQHAFDLTVGDAPAAAAAAGGTPAHPLRLLCCRFLEPPAAGPAAWDAASAPPFADRCAAACPTACPLRLRKTPAAACPAVLAQGPRHSCCWRQQLPLHCGQDLHPNLVAPLPHMHSHRPLTTAQVVAHYQQQGLEQAFVPAGASAPAHPPASQAGQLSALHWLRPGLLCFAAVSSGAQLLLAFSGCSGSGGGAGANWTQLPPVQLPLSGTAAGADVAMSDGGGTAASGQLQHADVAPVGAEALLVAAATPGQTLLFEVSGLRQQLLAASSGSDASQHQPRVTPLALPTSVTTETAATLGVALLPVPGSGGASARLVVVSSSTSGGGTTAASATCTGSGSGFEHEAYRMQAGTPTRLCPDALPAAALAASADGSALAALLPGACQLLWLGAGTGGLTQQRPPARLSAAAAPLAGVAVSPHNMYAAVAVAGASALLLLPLLEPPSKAYAVEHFMLEVSKR